jgi:hypothetical protein
MHPLTYQVRALLLRIDKRLLSWPLSLLHLGGGGVARVYVLDVVLFCQYQLIRGEHACSPTRVLLYGRGERTPPFCGVVGGLGHLKEDALFVLWSAKIGIVPEKASSKLGGTGAVPHGDYVAAF